jgi:cell division septum initiation protein DivIVA
LNNFERELDKKKESESRAKEDEFKKMKDEIEKLKKENEELTTKLKSHDIMGTGGQAVSPPIKSDAVSQTSTT